MEGCELIISIDRNTRDEGLSSRSDHHSEYKTTEGSKGHLHFSTGTLPVLALCLQVRKKIVGRLILFLKSNTHLSVSNAVLILVKKLLKIILDNT